MFELLCKGKYMKQKSKSLSQLIKEADSEISLFVRMSAADENGVISCVCCGERVYFKDADCAHYKDRDNMSTRFYLPNLGAASRDCNRFDHYGHIERWEKKMGTAEMARLNVISHRMDKWTRFELEELIEDYRAKNADLRNKKGL